MMATSIFFHTYINRFLSPDTIVPNPMDPQSLNRYTYARNNPVNRADPTGHVDCNLLGDANDSAGCNNQPTLLPPVPVVQLQFDSDGTFDPRKTWMNLTDVDLLARLIISEESNKILDPSKRDDAIGAAWTAVSRTRSGSGYLYAENNLFEAIVANGQFLGMIQPGQAGVAANPEAYPQSFLVGDKNAGRAGYWAAIDIAEGILDGSIPDPTDGRLIYGDALSDGTKRERTAFWYTQGSFINDPVDPHLTIPQIRQQNQMELFFQLAVE